MVYQYGTDNLKCSRTTQTSSCPGCRNSRQCGAWPGPRQPTVCWTNYQYFQFTILQNVVGPHLGQDPMTVVCGGLLHSGLTPPPHPFISSWGGNPKHCYREACSIAASLSPSIHFQPGWEPRAVVWGGLLHSSLTATQSSPSSSPRSSRCGTKPAGEVGRDGCIG